MLWSVLGQTSLMQLELLAGYPGKEHWEAVKWILRYLRGTSNVCLCFGNGELMLDGYTNSYMVGNVDSRKSIPRFLMTFAARAVSWQFKL